jgi:hypothetical protein
MFDTELYAIQSELEYRRERATGRRSDGHRVRRPRRDPYLPWLVRYGGRRAL